MKSPNNETSKLGLLWFWVMSIVKKGKESNLSTGLDRS